MTTRKTTPDILAAVLEAPGDRQLIRAQLRYDYSEIDPETRAEVQTAAVAIVQSGRRVHESILTIGQNLIGVKELLPHGQFEDRCRIEFGMSQSTVQNLMNVARTFIGQGKTQMFGLLSDSALYLLAAPSTPEAARAEVIERARNGDAPTVAAVKRTIAIHREPKGKPRKYETWTPAPITEFPPQEAERPPSEPAPLPPAAGPTVNRLPADLAAAGWELRQLGANDRYYCHNASGPRATGLHDTPGAAIKEAYATQIDLSRPQLVTPEPSDFEIDNRNLAAIAAVQVAIGAVANRWQARQVSITILARNGAAQWTVEAAGIAAGLGQPETISSTADTLAGALRKMLHE